MLPIADRVIGGVCASRCALVTAGAATSARAMTNDEIRTRFSSLIE
jgi:hypothetical protein